MEPIVFDTTSGISLEEQKEILAGINAISDGRRLAPEAAVTEAKKKGFLFPLWVNIGAFILLILGIAVLSRLHVNDEQQIRGSSAALGFTERRLIQEIRLETDRQIREKENRINDILAKLSAVDTEYRELQVSVENMTDVQKQRSASLLVLQEEYQLILSGLEEEKARILEDSRLQEEALRAQAAKRAGEFASRLEQDQAKPDAALEELKPLDREQKWVKRIEAQMGGFYAAVNNHISGGRTGEASSALKAMREFLAAPAFQGVLALEARKQTHLAAIAAMEEALSLSGDVQGENLADLKDRNAVLEQRTANLERDIAAFGAQGSDQGRIIAEYAAAIRELETARKEQQQTLSRRDSEIETLRTEIGEREQQVSELNGIFAALQAQHDDLQRRMEAAIKAFMGD
jgi:chromosome segregation ATPase